MTTLTSARTFTLHRLPALLRWAEDGADVVADTMAAHRALLGHAMSSLLARVDELSRSDSAVAGSSTVRDLAPAWARAENGARWRVTSAPATCRRVLWMPHRPLEAARWIGAGLAHEEAAAARAGELEHRSWSALGDRRLGPGRLPPVPTAWDEGRKGDPDVVVRPPHGDAGRATLQQAPVFGGGIPVDARSPLARAVHLSRCQGPSVTWPEFDEATIGRVVARLDEAGNGLRATAPVAAALVETFTTVVVIRGPGVGFGHGSTVVDLGRTVIMDPSSACASVARLAEGLLHEAVHHLCNVTVRDTRWVEDPAATVTVESPWTGNPLPLWAYLQACLVWAGMRAFWARARDLGTFDRAHAEERHAVAAHGFEAGPVLDRIPAGTRAGVHPLVAAAIDESSRP